MRMRRKPWVREELANCEFFVENPCEILGNWGNKFKKKQPLHLELGCGKGTFIAKLACENPEINYVAVDIKSEVLGLAKRNIEAEYLEKNQASSASTISSISFSISACVFAFATTSSLTKICLALESILRSPVERPRVLSRYIKFLTT